MLGEFNVEHLSHFSWNRFSNEYKMNQENLHWFYVRHDHVLWAGQRTVSILLPYYIEVLVRKGLKIIGIISVDCRDAFL